MADSRLKFAVGAHVTIADLDKDTGLADGVPVSSLASSGEIVEASAHPPGVKDDPEDPDQNRSPHYLVRLAGAGDATHDVWFTEPRLEQV